MFLGTVIYFFFLVRIDICIFKSISLRQSRLPIIMMAMSLSSSSLFLMDLGGGAWVSHLIVSRIRVILRYNTLIIGRKTDIVLDIYQGFWEFKHWRCLLQIFISYFSCKTNKNIKMHIYHRIASISDIWHSLAWRIHASIVLFQKTHPGWNLLSVYCSLCTFQYQNLAQLR